METLVKKSASAPSTQKPVHVFRLKGISASVFANPAKGDGQEILYYKVSLQRVYRDGDEWKTATTFGRDDLPIASLLLKRAWESILDTEALPDSTDK